MKKINSYFYILCEQYKKYGWIFCIGIITSSLFLYLFIKNHSKFSKVISFETTGPAFSVPAVNEKFLFVGSGFSYDCQTKGEIRAFDKQTLELVWKSQIQGSIGDTNLQLVDNIIIFGAGDGVAAVSTEDGRLLWHKSLKGCFQESFIKVKNRKIYVGSSTGEIYSLNLKGEVLWKNRLEGSVFAAPVIHNNKIFFVDMKNNVAALKVKTGDIIWKKNFFEDENPKGGFFSSPLIHENILILTSHSGNILNLSLEGHVISNNSTKDGYAATPILCNGDIIVANLASQVDWLSSDDLQSKYSIQLPGKFIFGTPQCKKDIVILTTYGDSETPSVLYYLNNGNVIKSVNLPCCHHALTTTIIDNKNLYNVLTPFSNESQENKYHVNIYHSRFTLGY